jgi:solute carrier family 25 phosphate transporter 23/24/25/41
MDPLLESQNARDARVERLWRQLDIDKKGELDLSGLRKGLRKIDHRMFISLCADAALTYQQL